MTVKKLILTLKRSQGKKQFVMQFIIGPRGGGGNSHTKAAGMVAGNFELNP